MDIVQGGALKSGGYFDVFLYCT